MGKTTKAVGLTKKNPSSKKSLASNASKATPKKAAPKKAAPKTGISRKVPKTPAPETTAVPAHFAPVASPELVKRKRTKINLETYIEKINEAVKKCDVEIERLSSNPSGERKGIKTLKSVRRTLFKVLIPLRSPDGFEESRSISTSHFLTASFIFSI